MRHWDAWSDGRRSQLFSIALDEAGLANGTPVNLTAGIDGDVPGKPFGGREDYAVQPGRAARWRSRCARCRSASPGRLTSTSTRSPASGGTRAERDRRQSGLGWAAGLLARRLAARLPRHGPAGIRSRPLSSGAAQFEDGRQAPLTQELGPLDHELRLVARRQDAVRDHRPSGAAARCGPSTRRPAERPRSPATGRSRRFSVGPKKIFFTLSNLASSGGSLRGRVRRRQAAAAHASESSASSTSARSASTSNSASPAGTMRTSSAT